MRRVSIIVIGLVILIIAAIMAILAFTRMPNSPSARPAGVVVSLDTPANGTTQGVGILNTTAVTFTYTPVCVGDNIVSASLWLNASGTWQIVASNTTVVRNDTVNSFKYTLTSIGAFIWNVQIFNSTTGVLAKSNNTLLTSRTAIRIEPVNLGKLAVNSTFTVNVTVENCEVFAVQVDIRYDPQVLNVTAVSEGTFLNSTGSTHVLFAQSAPVINSTPPRDTVFFVDTHVGDNVKGTSGNGTLLTITFKVLSEGSTQLQFFPYKPGSGSMEGTYFIKVNPDQTQSEIIPELHNSSYG